MKPNRAPEIMILRSQLTLKKGICKYDNKCGTRTHISGLVYEEEVAAPALQGVAGRKPVIVVLACVELEYAVLACVMLAYGMLACVVLACVVLEYVALEYVALACVVPAYGVPAYVAFDGLS